MGLREALSRRRVRIVAPPPVPHARSSGTAASAATPRPRATDEPSSDVTARDYPAGLRVLGPSPGIPLPHGVPDPASPPPGRPGPGATPQRARERALVRQAWVAVADRRDSLVRRFYAELFFSLGDDALRMFPAGMAEQRDEFGRVLVQWVTADDPEGLAVQLAQLGDDHRKYGAHAHHYETAGQALVTAWAATAGSRWNADLEDAVIGAYARLAALMLDGAARRRDEPASWPATVVGHERLRDDVAIVRLQPDAPYDFRPGQYLTVEAASLPKVWRQMSIASAPRPDNTLDLQVRAVAATGLSGTLVMHTAVGDRVRIGPPRGSSLVVAAGSTPTGLLCVCSGSGAAPVTAVVDAMVRRDDCPPIVVFVGARTGADLYAVDHVMRLAAAAGRSDRVEVHGVVSDDDAFAGHHGRVEQVVPRLRDWAALGVDVLVAGPSAMIGTTVARLATAGVPADRIRFDQFDLP